MKKLRDYLDTSVVGGCFDQQFAVWSNALEAGYRPIEIYSPREMASYEE